MSDLTHSFTVDPQSRAIRFYLWLYAADPRNINTCKLFWGFVLAPVFLVGRAIVTGLAWAANRAVGQPRRRPPADLFQGRALSRSESRLDRAALALSSAWAKHRGKVRALAAAIGIAYFLALLAFIVVAFIQSPLAAGVVFGSVAIVVALGVLTARLSPRLLGFCTLLRRLGRSVHDHTCARVVLEEERP